MQKLVVAAVIEKNTVEQLFETVAPLYDPSFMLAVLPKEFADLSESELNARIAEFLKFIYLRSLWVGDQTGFVPVKKAIDEIWHAFIVQTREYIKFCAALPGKVFLHHTTAHLEDIGEQQDKKVLVKEMLAWIPRYREHFGPFTETTAPYWMMPGFLQEALNLSLNDINQL